MTPSVTEQLCVTEQVVDHQFGDTNELRGGGA